MKKTSIIERFGQVQETEWFNSSNNLKVTTTNFPQGDFRRRCYNMIKATWQDRPEDYELVEQFAKLNGASSIFFFS